MKRLNYNRISFLRSVCVNRIIRLKPEVIEQTGSGQTGLIRQWLKWFKLEVTKLVSSVSGRSGLNWK